VQPKFLDRAAVVSYLATLGVKTSVPTLQNLASQGCGPRYCLINGRALSTAEWVDAWVAAQAERDPHEAKRGRSQPTEPNTRNARSRKTRQVAAA
jgi:hypothetical protein